MDRVVYVVSDPADVGPAEQLAASLVAKGFTVHHNGTVDIGKSRIAEANRRIAQGIPFIICGTMKSISRPWTHELAHAAHAAPASQVFVVQMEGDIYVEQLALSRVVADYWKNPDQAISRLATALAKLFPEDPQNPPGAEVLTEHGYLDQLAGITSFDLEALAEYRGMLRNDADGIPPASLSPWEFLVEAGLMREGQLTRAGVLLVGQHTTQVLPAASVQCLHYLGETKVEPGERSEFTGTVPQQIIRALAFVAERCREGEAPTAGSAFVEPVYRYPMEAVREIIANALVHRDYQDPHMYVHVRLFTDRLEVVNPGTWLSHPDDDGAEVPLEILHDGESRKRNVRLARALTWIRMVEGGVDPIRRTGSIS